MRKLALLVGAAAAAAAIYWVFAGRERDLSPAGTGADRGAAAEQRRAERPAGAASAARAPSVRPGFVPPPTDEGRPSITPPLEVPATAKDGFVEVTVKRAGAPVQAAEVRLYARGAFDRGAGHADWRTAGAAKTGADGVAKLPARPGPYLAVARADRSPPARKQFTRAQGEQTTRVQIDLESTGAALFGRTVPRGGK